MGSLLLPHGFWGWKSYFYTHLSLSLLSPRPYQPFPKGRQPLNATDIFPFFSCFCPVFCRWLEILTHVKVKTEKIASNLQSSMPLVSEEVRADNLTKGRLERATGVKEKRNPKILMDSLQFPPKRTHKKSSLGDLTGSHHPPPPQSEAVTLTRVPNGCNASF